MALALTAFHLDTVGFQDLVIVHVCLASGGQIIDVIIYSQVFFVWNEKGKKRLFWQFKPYGL